MINQSKIRRKSVDLHPPARPSRIRREPVPDGADKPLTLFGKVDFHSREWEIRLAVIGITVFALGICAVVLDVGEALSH